MIAIILTALGLVTGSFEAYHDFKDLHPVPFGEVPPYVNGNINPSWVEGCTNAFKSFDKDSGLWFDGKRYHYCRLKWVKQ